MGSVLAITVYGDGAGACREAVDAAYAEVERLESLLSVFRDDSELSRVNRFAAADAVPTDPELVWLIQRGLASARLTNGAVDPTVAPLMRLWGFREQEGSRVAPPSSQDIRAVLESVGSRHVVVDARRASVSYRRPGVELEFGALGKGYAVDRAVDVLRRRRMAAGLVHFGSSTFAFGAPPGERAWRVALRAPENPGRISEVIALRDRALSTSGDDQQGIRLQGRWYGHVLDPRTGYPAANLAGASVVAPTALEADALSTAALVLGREILPLLETRPGVEGRLLRSGGDRAVPLCTTGWERHRAAGGRAASFSRRRLLVGAAAGLAWLVVRPALGRAMVYMSAEDALKELAPDADARREAVVRLSPDQKNRVEQALGSRVRDEAYQTWVIERGGGPIAYVVLLNVIGKEQPITFMVAVTPDGAVKGIEVLVYRESEGSGIRSSRFMGQFTGKTLAAPLIMGRDVQAISGATLSSRSTAYAAKKALALVEVLYRNPSGDSR